jgi:hypothetical protein
VVDDLLTFSPALHHLITYGGLEENTAPVRAWSGLD